MRDFPAALQSLAEIQFESTQQQTAIALKRALCHFCLYDYSAAVKELTLAYERGGTPAETVRMLITAHHHLRQLETARDLAQANAEQAQVDGALAGTFAVPCFDVGDVAKATQWTRIGLQLQPGNIDGRIVEGHLLMLRRQLDQSRRILESVAYDAPTTARAWIGLGSLALIDNDAGKAIALLERGLKLMPQHVGTWHSLGWTKLMQRDLAGAGRALTHALSLDSNFAESHGALAALDAIRGDLASAQRRIDVAETSRPELHCQSIRCRVDQRSRAERQPIASAGSAHRRRVRPEQPKRVEQVADGVALIHRGWGPMA